jgi:hypothetical protein
MDAVIEEFKQISVNHDEGNKLAGRPVVNIDYLIREFNSQLSLVSIPDEGEVDTDKIEIPINNDTWHPHDFFSVMSAASDYQTSCMQAELYASRLREWFQQADGNRHPHHNELLSQILHILALKRMEAMAIYHFCNDRVDKWGPAAETPFAKMRLLSQLERVSNGRDCARRMFHACSEMYDLLAIQRHTFDSKQYDDFLKEMIRIRDGANGERAATWLRDWLPRPELY